MIFLPEDRIDFDLADNMGSWQASGGTQFRVVGDAVEFRKGKNGFLIALPQVNLGADQYDVCRIEGLWPIAHDQSRLFFISPFNRQFDFNFRYDFDTGPGGRMRGRYIDLRGHGAWQGMIRGLMIMPATNADKVVLKRLSFIHANPWTRIKAWWSTFTRYQDPLLGTCLAMATPIFIGKPFNSFFVFKTKGNYIREYLKFYVVYGASMGINMVYLPVCVEFFRIFPPVAQAGWVFINVIISYLGHKHFSFSPKRQSAARKSANGT